MDRIPKNAFRVALIVIGLAGAMYAACGDLAFADDPRVLPRGTMCKKPKKPGAADGVSVVFNVDRWAISRAQIDQANADARAVRLLKDELLTVSRRALDLSAPEPGWRIAARWTGIGAAIGAAFVAGLMLR